MENSAKISKKTGDAVDMKDPKSVIEDYDWNDMEQRYIQKMKEFEQREEEVFQEWHQLNEMFMAWAAAGQAKDIERAGKRLKTRVTFVQNYEDQLLEKRNHYLQVVDAFRSALGLLENV